MTTRPSTLSLHLICAVAISLTTLYRSGSLRAQEADTLDFFEKRVRPALIEHCYECHSGQQPESDFNAETLEGLLRGGKRGPAIVPGDAEHSLLILAINHADQLHMPPKSKIPVAEIANISAWVQAGAHWPNAERTSVQPETAHTATEITDEQRGFWAFQPPQQPQLPAVSHVEWIQSPIDYFILAKLEQAGLQPASASNPRTWIRRVTFDLTGLPPSLDETNAFLADPSPDAKEKVVDRLLASPRYGERWGRTWLDIARYADSNGLDENLAYAAAFRYRDYVIASLNHDKPYDRFLVEQIAGDLLPVDDPTSLEQPLIGTGFLSLGAKMLAEDDPVKMQMDIIDEQIDTIGRAVLGLTLGCARCHDHKFDPIPTADYYALAGIFKSTRTMENFSVVARWQERPLASTEAVSNRNAIQARISELTTQIDNAKGDAVIQVFAAGFLNALQIIPVYPSAGNDIDFQASSEAVLEVLKLDQQKKDLTQSLPVLPEAMAVSEESPQNVRIHIRGSHISLGAEVPRGFPQVLVNGKPPPIDPNQSGRLDLARWLTQAEHPLTARVIVNRLWQGHFGEGLVRSPDNFGALGEKPTHPELLDYLALRLIDEEWSLKALHRMMVLSSTYEMTSQWNEAAAAIDPENRLYWRHNRRRLEAEAIRDAILAISDSLDLTMGGTMLPTKNREYVTSTASVDPVVYHSPRRSVYIPVVRSALYEVFQAFDFPDPSVSNGRRDSTNVAPQALFMMNSELVAESSRKLARQIQQRPTNDSERIRELFQLAYTREPTPADIEDSLVFSQQMRTEYKSRGADDANADLQAWQSYCRVLLSANEFIYVE